MKKTIRIILSVIICFCMSTAAVSAASSATAKKAAVTAMQFNEWTSTVVDVGSTAMLVVKNNKSELQWSSNHPDVVSVDGSGRVWPQRPGNAVITATGANGSRAFCTVYVSCDGGLISRKTLDYYGAAKCSKLMIVAHPDDETIFGGRHLRQGGWFVVCITNGYNPTRAREFRNTLQSTGNLGMIMDYPDYQDERKDSWSHVKKGVAADVSRIIGYKNWKKVVTHNKWGEYGHIHHKMTHAIVRKECIDKSVYDRLRFFGIFYWPNDIPYNEKRLSDWDAEQKMDLALAYESQRGAVNNLAHIIPYENWLKAPWGDKVVSKKFKLKTSIKGKPAAGYRITSVRMSRNNVTLKGKRSRIKKLVSKKAVVRTPAVNVKGKAKSFKVKVPLKKLLPKGTALGKNMPRKVTVYVTINKVEPAAKATAKPAKSE